MQVKALVDAYKKAKAPAAFEQAFLTHAILALDHYFLHRMRGAEGKDGNALNEVRMLCDSIKHHDSVMSADQTIRYKADKAILGTEIGAPICVSADGFAELADAFFNEIEVRYQ